MPPAERSENQSLRGQISELESERRRLSDKIGAAAKRLEELKEAYTAMKRQGEVQRAMLSTSL